MRVFIAGSSGQVARALTEQCTMAGLEALALGRPDFDLGDAGSVERALERFNADIVINAAAYTAVDKAESEIDKARQVNATGAGTLARRAAGLGLPILHLSTDYVFDGTKKTPYQEIDPVSPLGIYGQTKLEGEQQVADGNARHVVLRTSWVYSPFGNNFVKTMLRLAADRDEVNVVSDQKGNPTSATDIAINLIKIAKQLHNDKSAPTGLFHMSGQGDAVWADLAEAVFEASARHSGPSAKVNRISTADYPTPAPRPANSRLDCQKLEDGFGVRLPDWTSSVRSCVERLVGTSGS